MDELRLYLYAPLDCDLALSLAFQYFFAIVTVALVLITPESPRWLIMKNRVSEAQNILARLLSKQYNDAVVVSEIQHLVASVHHEAEVQESVALKEIFTFNSKQQKLRRMLLGAGTAFFQQVGGTNVIAYYLPVVLTRSVGLSSRMALILSAVDSMSLMFWGSMAALLTDRVGRKKLMLMGVAASSVCFALVAVGLRYGGPDNQGMSILAVVFIFVYYVFYGMSLLSIPYIYPAEINSQKMRNIGTPLRPQSTGFSFMLLWQRLPPSKISSGGTICCTPFSTFALSHLSTTSMSRLRHYLSNKSIGCLKSNMTQEKT